MAYSDEQIKQYATQLQSKGALLSDIESFVKQAKAGQTATPSDTANNAPDGILGGLYSFGTGLGKSTLNLGLNLAKTALNVTTDIGKMIGADTSYSEKYAKGIEDIKGAISQTAQPQTSTLPGKTGEVVGTVAPYISMGGPISETTNVVSSTLGRAGEVLSDLTGLKSAPALLRVLGGATAEGAQNYALAYALTGGDKNQAKWQAIISGGLKGVTSAIGEFLSNAKVDTKLMSSIYGDTKADVASQLKYGTEPKQFAQEALDRGITGNTEQQAVQIQKGINDSEKALMGEFEKAGNPPIQLNNPQRYIDAINNRANLLEKAGATTEAQGLRSSLNAINPDGTIAANNALALRRFLDSLRMDKSYLAQTEELGAQQAGLKEMTDALRYQINQIGQNSSIMKDYQFYTKAMNKLTDYAFKQGKKPVIDFFTGLLGAESLLQHSLLGGLMALGRKSVGLVPASKAQFIKNLPTSSAGGTALRSGILPGLSSLAPVQGNQSTNPPISQ